MNPNKKVFITVLSFVLTMLVIACSCSSLIPTTTPTQSSGQQPATVPAQTGSQEPATVPAQSSNQEPMPGLAGTWQDPFTLDTFVIAWQNGQYVVTSITLNGATLKIASQSWSGTSLKWTYYTLDGQATLTYETTSLSGDSLNTNWSNDQGPLGPHTLNRVTP